MLVACQSSVLDGHILLMWIGRRGSDVSIKKRCDLEQPQLLGSTNPPINMILYPLELLTHGFAFLGYTAKIGQI